MKRLLLLTVILLFLGLILAGWLYSKDENLNNAKTLPWETTLSSSGATHVFGMDIGRLTLKEMMLSLHKLAELSVFEKKNGELNLEAYFGKTRLGMFDASLIADIDAAPSELKNFISLRGIEGRKGMPSGSWKYELTEESIQQANDMRIWRLVYMPTANYDVETIVKQFGEPESKESLSEGLVYWYYPEKGVAVLEDKDGREIFYYVAPDEFSRLEMALPKESSEIK